MLIPDDWHEDIKSGFPGRFVGSPEFGDFWPGQQVSPAFVLSAGVGAG
jgi:hypothetical protein